MLPALLLISDHTRIIRVTFSFCALSSIRIAPKQKSWFLASRELVVIGAISINLQPETEKGILSSRLGQYDRVTMFSGLQRSFFPPPGMWGIRMEIIIVITVCHYFGVIIYLQGVIIMNRRLEWESRLQ